MSGTDLKKVTFLRLILEQEGEHKGNSVVENGAATPLAAKNMTRSHSISNDRSKWS